MYTGGSLRSPAAHALSSDTCEHEATAPIVAESASSSPDQRSVRQAAVLQEMVALPVGSFLETLHQNHQQRKGHQSQSEAAVQEGEEWAHEVQVTRWPRSPAAAVTVAAVPSAVAAVEGAVAAEGTSAIALAAPAV